MKRFEARIEFIDVRVVTVEAESEEEARAKFDTGEWENESTVDFYSNREIEPLHFVEERD